MIERRAGAIQSAPQRCTLPQYTLCARALGVAAAQLYSFGGKKDKNATNIKRLVEGQGKGLRLLSITNAQRGVTLRAREICLLHMRHRRGFWRGFCGCGWEWGCGLAERQAPEGLLHSSGHGVRVVVIPKNVGGRHSPRPRPRPHPGLFPLLVGGLTPHPHIRCCDRGRSRWSRCPRSLSGWEILRFDLLHDRGGLLLRSRSNGLAGPPLRNLRQSTLLQLYEGAGRTQTGGWFV